MANPPKRNNIDPAGFPNEVQEGMQGLAGTLNAFIRDTVDCLEKGLDFKNINQDLVTIRVRVDASGVPIQGGSFKNTLKSKQVEGIQVIRAINVQSSAIYPTSHPFISYIENDKVVTIRNVTGLQANNSYDLTLLVI